MLRSWRKVPRPPLKEKAQQLRQGGSAFRLEG